MNKQAYFDYVYSLCGKLNITQQKAYSVTICPPTTMTSEKSQSEYLLQKLEILNEMGVQYICVFEWQKTSWHLHLIIHSDFAAKCKNYQFTKYIEPTKNLLGYINYMVKNIEILGINYIRINNSQANQINSQVDNKQIATVNSQNENAPKEEFKKQAIQKKHNTLIEKIFSYFNYTTFSRVFFYQKKFKYFNDS